MDLSNPIYDGCRRSKACFGDPENCIDRKDCKIFASVLVRGAKVYEFELMAESSRYVAVGLSDDGSMVSYHFFLKNYYFITTKILNDLFYFKG